MRVASYNIRKSVGLDWKRQPSRILDVLDEMNADIIALQEVDRRFFDKRGTLPIADLLHKHNYKFVDVDTTKEASSGWHGNAILYRETIKLLSSNRVSFPAIEPRGAVAAVFELANTNKPFQFIATHLSLLGYMRVKQVNALCAYIENSNTRIDTVLAGDFNEWRKFGKTERAFNDDFDVVTPGPSFHSTRPSAALDRFVLWGGCQLIKSYVHNSETSRKASDHLPIYMDINLSE